MAFARPKSSTLTVPSGRTLMFAGFRSRWTMPCSCAASSASAICFAMSNASIEWDRSAGGSLRQVLALDELHDEGAHAARFLEAVNVRDVRMVQRRERLSFPCEPGEPFGIVSERVRQDLERDVAIELRVASLIHLSHATFADRRSDFVHAEAGTGSEGQMMWIIGSDQRRPYDYSRVAPQRRPNADRTISSALGDCARGIRRDLLAYGLTLPCSRCHHATINPLGDHLRNLRLFPVYM